MESEKETGSPRRWECCPIELLYLIFRKLDTDSLVNCMYVCRSWNSVALYKAEKNNLWEKLVNKLIVDKGQMVKMKSKNMSWKDIFENSMLWSHCAKAELSVHNTYELSDLKHVHVYKDNLIIVSSSGVKYFDITKSNLKRDIKMICDDFLENDKMILKATCQCAVPDYKTYQLHLYGKRYVNDFNILEERAMRVDEVIHYSTNKERCYLLDKRGLIILYEFKNLHWNEQLVARYYGSCETIASLHIFQDKPYLLLKSGRVLCANGLTGFEGVMNAWYPQLELGHITYTKMFHILGVIYGVQLIKEYRLYRYDVDKYKAFVMQCPELTCATEHGEMLFLGYSDGKIEFFMPRELNEEAALKRQHHVAQHSNNCDNNIISIDVYDERDRHHVFVATRSQVHHLLLNHTNMNDYLWSEYPYRMSLAAEPDF